MARSALRYRGRGYFFWSVAVLLAAAGSSPAGENDTNAAGVASTSASASSPARRSIVILGDSLAAGYGVDPAEAFPALLQEKIDAAQLKFTIVNAGLSGDTTAGGLRRVDWVLRRPVDVLVIELGGNDGLRGLQPTATQTNLQGIIDRTRARYPRAEIVLAGMQMPPNLGLEFTEAFRRVYPEVARSNHLVLIPFLLEGVGGRPELNQTDGIHPTVEGHRRVAETVWKYLQPALEKAASPLGSPSR